MPLRKKPRRSTYTQGVFNTTIPYRSYDLTNMPISAGGDGGVANRFYLARQARLDPSLNAAAYVIQRNMRRHRGTHHYRRAYAHARNAYARSNRASHPFSDQYDHSWFDQLFS